MKYQVFFFLIYSTLLNGQEYDWLRMSDSGLGDTIFARFDSLSTYMPLIFDDVYDNGSIQNQVHELYGAKRDHNTIGILYYDTDYKANYGNDVSYAKFVISKDSAWVINNGGYFSLYHSPRGTLPWILADASTVVVPHRKPIHTYMDYYSDDGRHYRYTCDTTQAIQPRIKKWQRYPWPPPGNYHKDK